MIGFFVISTQLGGAERSLLDFFKHSPSTKDFIVIVPKETGPFIDELKKISIEHEVLRLPIWFLQLSRKKLLRSILKVPLIPFLLLNQIIKINQFAQEKNVHQIHTTGIKYHILLCLYGKWNKSIPILIHLRDVISKSYLKEFFYSFNKQPNIQFIANSKATAEALPDIEMTILYNCFDEKYFKVGSSDLKANLGLAKSTPLIALVGVVARWKGQREFIDAAKLVLQKMPQVHFLIVGDEIYDTDSEIGEKQYLVNKISQLNLESSFHFLGFQKDLLPVYNGIDILVHASIYPEPFGRVIVEAMLCERPVTASKSGGPLEIINPPKDGLLHIPTDQQSMANNILELLTDKNKYQEISKQARQTSLRFNMNEYVTKLNQLLNH